MSFKKFPYLLVFLFILSVLAFALFAKEAEYQWKVDDLLTTDQVSDAQISPDGTKLAWIVTKWNLEEQKSYQIIYMASLTSKDDDIQLTRGEDRFSSLQWVPGKDQISYRTNRKFKKTKENNLWIMDINGGEPYPLTNFEKGIQQYQWIDKDNFLYSSREAESLYEKEKKEKKNTAVVVEDEDHRVITRLFHYDVKEKKSTRLTDNKKPLQRFFLSRDKNFVIYGISMSMIYGQDQEIRPRYFLMDLKTKQSQEIFTDLSLKPFGSFEWAMDNTGFYAPMAYSTHPKYTMASVMKLYWYDLKSHTFSEINLGWKNDGGSYSVTRDGFVMSLPNGVHFKHARYYKEGNTWKRSWIEEESQKNVRIFSMADDGTTMIYAYSTASIPARYYLAELKKNQFLRKWEVIDLKSPLFKRPLAKTEIITWKGALDEMVEGILYYPYKYQEGKKYPLILMIHGGPNGADTDFFRERWAYPAHLMCERGAFVLKVNYHGSSNYGLTFGESIAGHYYEYEIPDIENGVELLIKQGKVDKDRLGIIGWSNGAILGTALTVHTDRYKAASLGAGDVNWTSDYGNCAFGVAFDNYYFNGPPWDNIEHYIKKSPIFQMKKVTTPTLIFHGSEDRSVPYEQGWEYYRALKVIGNTPVRFISFPGEGHGPRKLAHQRVKLNEEIRWFEKYLFQTLKDQNEALKEGSPLDMLTKYRKISKVKGLFGVEKNGFLIPEVVEYKKLTIGRFEVTRAQWAFFDKDYTYPEGTGNVPATGITFDRAVEYTKWLSSQTGETFRLPKLEEKKTLYNSRSGNTFDYWAGYSLNPDDYQKLQKELEKYGDEPVLLKEAGQFKAAGENLVFDLGGNAAEWVDAGENKGEACGGSADISADSTLKILPGLKYTGLRVIQEINKDK
ncbi:MAG: prolyl oligopeptidase family serine peptidase [Candidatus Aminicenantes bacterium]|nr:prolyl oligopeptidase family serine peptidase [Candidatus Aminicenantes bacterium]